MLCSVRICKHARESKSTCTRCVGGPGRLPTPSPAPLTEPWGEGGGEAGELCPARGILSRERGDLWLVSWAGLIRMWIWQVYMASLYGKSIRQDILAGLFGGSVWRGKWAHLFKRFEICKLRYHYVVSNIVLFALLQVHRNQQIVVLVPWLCGSVNLTANENIHHEEERTSFDCCSARFCWSRHQPGYVQGG